MLYSDIIEICSVPKYTINYDKAKKYQSDNIETINALINKDLQYHERIKKDDYLKLFLDVDKLTLHNPSASIDKIFQDLCDYVNSFVLSPIINKNDISYTQNPSITSGSYHIVIPKFCMSSFNQKQFWINFKNKYNYDAEIDTNIYYREGWFRLPNQSKNSVAGTEHIIVNGSLSDFVLKYTKNCDLFSWFIDNSNLKKPEKKSKTQTINTEDNQEQNNLKKYNQIKQLVSLLKPERAKEHQSWFKVACILRNELGKDGLQIFKDWTLEHGTDNKKIECTDKFNKDTKIRANNDKKKLTIATLIQYVKEDSPEEYAKLYPNLFKDNFTEEDNLFEEALYNQKEFTIAKYFNYLFKQNHICSSLKSKNYYTFTDKNLWEYDEVGTTIRRKISNEFAEKIIKRKNEIQDILLKTDEESEEYDIFKKRSQLATELVNKLYATQAKNNIFREIIDDIIDTDFENKLNKEHYVLPIKNKKMINLITHRVYDRTIDNKFNYECDAEYIHLTQEDYDFVDNYFMSLFCNDRDTCDSFIDVLKSCLLGFPLKYIFFLTGSGNNGKSCLFNVLKDIFKNAMDILSKSVVIKSKNKSSLSTELMKVDKCRIGYICELSETDELDVEMAKTITGGDTVDVRGLYEKNRTVLPTCNTFVLTNEVPSFKFSDQAIVNRLVKFPMNNTFEKNSAFEEKLKSNKNAIFSYIIDRGIVREKFIISEAMQVAKNELLEDNMNDPLKDFIEENFEIVNYDETEETRVNRDNFRSAYNQYCLDKMLPINKMTNTKFTRLMKVKFGVDYRHLGKTKKTFFIGIRPIKSEEANN